MNRRPNRTQLTPMFLDHEITLHFRGRSGTSIELRLTGKVFPSHRMLVPVQLRSSHIVFFGLQILHLSPPHEQQGMLLLQNRRGRMGKHQHRKWSKKVRKGQSFIVKSLLPAALRFKRIDALVFGRLDGLLCHFYPVSFCSAVY